MAEAEVDRFLADQRHKCDQLFEGMSVFGDMTSVTTGISLFGDNVTNEDRLEKYRGVAETSVDDGNGTEIRQCPPTFDGLLCWPRTDAPGTATLPCPPASIMGYTELASDNLRALAVASKVCLTNGEWYRNSDGVAWSNYSLCVLNSTRYIIDKNLNYMRWYETPAEFALLNKWLPIIRMVSHIGYVTSFTTLIVAMVVFSLLRKLRNPRNRLHMHLFASFIMRAFMALLKDWSFIDGIGLAWDVVFVDGQSAFIRERNSKWHDIEVIALINQSLNTYVCVKTIFLNCLFGFCFYLLLNRTIFIFANRRFKTWVCKVITSLWQYFIVANYSWILMEGMYLHNLVFFALCTDTSTIALYIVLGWGLPALVVVPWIIIRATIENTLCWTTNDDSSLFLIIRIPIITSILFNFLLFLNIVRVLLVKLKTSVYLQRKKMKYKRWAKSTLVLVPLFGIHYTFFLGLSYHKGVELVWLFCDQLFASFQGAFVAFLYCLLNGEVRAEMRRAWKARQSKREVDSFTSGHTRNSRDAGINRKRHRSEGDDGTNFAIATMKKLTLKSI